MKKLLLSFAAIMASVVLMAQSQFYVIMKDGSGASFPEATVDSLTFNDDNGATIYGLKDLANSIAQLKNEVAELKKLIANQSGNGSESNHEYVDLGLPSGTLWSTCNIGSETPYDFGLYFRWGEPDTKSSKEVFTRTGGLWNGKSNGELSSEGVIDEYHNLTAKYDAATVLWGKDWKTPNEDEFKELVRYCTAQWTRLNMRDGYLFTSTINSQTIFLPCSGLILNKEELYVDTRGYYIGATTTGGTSTNLYLSQDGVSVGSMSRSHGRTIRPVRKKESNKPFFDDKDSIVNGHLYVDMGLPSGTLWASTNVGATNSSEIGTKFFWGFESTEIPSIYWDNGLLGNKEKLTELGIIDADGNLTYGRDAAMYNWGAQWRMPTIEECSELLSNTTKELITINDVKGWLLTAKNGNTLFFPVTDISSTYNFASYWSSSISPQADNSDEACILNIYDDSVILPLDWADYIKTRNSPLPVRPVVNIK